MEPPAVARKKEKLFLFLISFLFSIISEGGGLCGRQTNHWKTPIFYLFNICLNIQEFRNIQRNCYFHLFFAKKRLTRSVMLKQCVRFKENKSYSNWILRETIILFFKQDISNLRYSNTSKICSCWVILTINTLYCLTHNKGEQNREKVHITINK